MDEPAPTEAQAFDAAADTVDEHDVPKVLYVMGAGRSGSTILGITLGNCEGVFYAGELDKWLRVSGKPRLAGESREQFWELVRGEMHVPAVLRERPAMVLEQSSGLPLRPGAWRVQREMHRPYREFSRRLYRVIARTAGATHVVDTSHYPRRARQLQKTDGIDLHLLFIVRDPQDVVASWNRQIDGSRASRAERRPAQPGLATRAANAYLWLTHSLALYVFLRQRRDRRLLVRHETFLADPEAVLRDILDAAGSSAAIPDLSALETGNVFQANRVASADTVSLSRHASRPAPRSRLTAVLQLPWRIVFAVLGPVAGGRRRRAPAETSSPGAPDAGGEEHTASERVDAV